MSNFDNFSNSYRFILEKGSKKHPCPSCGKKTFVRYINTDTSNYLPLKYGRCDRESKCSYHLNPYTDEYYKTIHEAEAKITGITKITVPIKKISRSHSKSRSISNPAFIPVHILKQTLQSERYDQNVFVQNLLTRINFPFEPKDIENVISLYYLGTITSGYRSGAVTFPFIDIHGNIRTIQVKLFDETNHTAGTDFLHSIIEKYYTRNNKELPQWLVNYQKQDKRVSCLFGEHLLSKYPMNPVALVEAPKTAVYCTLYFGLPENLENFIWLAVYNKSSFSFDKIEVLNGRDVYTFPDLSEDGSTYCEWKNKAQDFENKLPGTRFIFSDLLENLAHEKDKQKGYDIADYLIKLDWRLFRANKKLTKTNEVILETGPQLVEEKDVIEDTPTKYQSAGDMFDLLKKNGYESMPENLQINIPHFPGQPLKSDYLTKN